MDIIFIICTLLFIFALIFHNTSYSEENNTTGYDDSILVIEVFDDDEEESKYELNETRNEQIRIEKLFLEQENKRFRNEKLSLIQEIQRIKNEMNNNINALQKQIYQMEEYTRLQFKEVLQKERTQLRTNYQNHFNEYFQYYNNYFQNLTLLSTEEIRRLTAMIEKKDTQLKVSKKFLDIKIKDCRSLEEHLTNKVEVNYIRFFESVISRFDKQTTIGIYIISAKDGYSSVLKDNSVSEKIDKMIEIYELQEKIIRKIQNDLIKIDNKQIKIEKIKLG
ncbi:hypothetical protein C2G38_2242063 [Gigaspora rosea]|uniref:DUF4200 domain-containing protein n=1 Tax=Gigaspora rosea TaxID=44941 RepID=A0A397VTQ0_9GLOM|nr:hypothetical protein C2G38_2242063 [Gigaspora rosea]